ncbi:ribonuclease Y [Candidatus Cerribacteria bacterium 'Amazon FNV 2010 28 9']|uniref:Ribonuclease Y n=1 Tax=Candidatus Cerribacteria bacterium 'Amazon FNV 2010 28 9' TaxID=2081795 RepID=A0A317JQM1_9BACT|nr:MAG: ribonuclease Y [Candidatus Cerribacteria bacterium 'Amazon FNV 2010 28 9']
MSFFRRLSGALTQTGDKSQSKPVAKQGSPKAKLEKPVIQKPVAPKVDPAQQQAIIDTAVREAQARAREIIVEAKAEALSLRETAEKELRQMRDQMTQSERSIDQKLAGIEARLKTLDDRERELNKRRGDLDGRSQQLEDTRKNLLKKLEQVAGLTREEAKTQILDDLSKKLGREMAEMVQEKVNQAKEEADGKAQEILVDAMKYGATSYVSEYTVSIVNLPSEEVKGKIIGKDGRNIRSFEQTTGVDVDLDDQPGTVRLSCFDPVRREVARVSLERLVKDGRIQPSRIEEVVHKVREEIEKIMFEEGKKLCHAVGVFNMPHDIIAMLGRFKYRFSYGQNMIAHTLEETKIGIALAHEVKANVDTVRLGCLLHDIGKVITEEEGSHVELGVELLRKYRMPQAVIDCVEQHHEDKPFSSKEAVLVYVADAISGARPGARYENYEEYVKRLTKLEEIAKSDEKVKEAYAIQAGREIRVIVDPAHSNDEDVVLLSHTIKDRIKNEVTYPGTVTVTVIREMRAVDIAK